MMRTKIIITAACLMVFLSSCKKDDGIRKIQFTGEAQGTYYAVTYFSDDTVVSQKQIDSLLRDFDLSASVWVPESIISGINNNLPDVQTNSHFADIFRQSKHIWKETNGAFDITVGPLVNAWGFGFKNKIPLNDYVIDSLKKLVDFEGVRLTDGKIIKSNPDIQIDYNAIAQGYSVDLTGGFFKSKGVQNFLVDIGGEVLGSGSKPGGKPWVVGIEKPSENADSQRTLNATIKINNNAVATSGSYRKFYEKDGIRYSHTIDPKTGYPVTHSLLSATVMTDSASIADAYATALMVMGLEKGKSFLANKPNLDAYLIYADENGDYKTWATEKMRALIEER